MQVVNRFNGTQSMPVNTAVQAQTTDEPYSFASALEKMRAAEKPPAVKQAMSVQQSASTVSTAFAFEETDYADIDWTSKSLASSIGGLLNPVKVEKTINSESKGDKQLTGEQIAELKSRYDVTNMTSQDYYDLLCDLTHMEVLSAEDCRNSRIRRLGGGTGMIPIEHGWLIRPELCPAWVADNPGKVIKPRPYPAFRSVAGETVNMVEYLASKVYHISDTLRWVKETDFSRSPYSVSDERVYAANLQSDIDVRQKILSVLRQLQ